LPLKYLPIEFEEKVSSDQLDMAQYLLSTMFIKLH